MSRASEAGAAGREGPLAGLRVVEFAAVIAGPSCARQLADHGADVIKVERFPDGDIARSVNAAGSRRSGMFVQHNGGKRGLCVDLARPEGLAIALDLARGADVVIEAFTPGVMDRLGLGWAALSAINPRLVMCSISGFGQTGPNAGRPGYAHIAHSATGWLAAQFLHHRPPQAPRGPGVAVADVMTAQTAFGAICAALFRRERTGRGDHVDIALFDSLFVANDDSMQRWLLSGEVDVFYHPVHPTRDGYVTANIGPDFRAWVNTCKAMGREDLLEDPRFRDARSLGGNRAAATALVRSWLATLDTAEAERRLIANHVVVGVVKTLPEAARQPQVEARALLARVEDPVHGPIEVINAAQKYAGADVGVKGPAPRLGEHNTEVLREVLGYDDARIEALRAAGVLREGEH